MAYFIEFGLSRGEGLYAEFVIINKNTGFVLPGDGIDHHFLIHREFNDYGSWRGAGQIIASNSNGLITAPEPGVIAMNIPPDRFRGLANDDFGWWGYGYRDLREETLRCKMLAVPADPNFTKTLFTGTISFGDRMMSSPRINLGVYPLYPNSATAVPIAPVVQVAQAQQQLTALALYDAVEAALPGPTDPATISWNVGGPLTIGGPLCNVIADVAGYDSTAMTLFLFAASQRTL